MWLISGGTKPSSAICGVDDYEKTLGLHARDLPDARVAARWIWKSTSGRYYSKSRSAIRWDRASGFPILIAPHGRVSANLRVLSFRALVFPEESVRVDPRFRCGRPCHGRHPESVLYAVFRMRAGTWPNINSAIWERRPWPQRRILRRSASLLPNAQMGERLSPAISRSGVRRPYWS